MKFSRLFYDSSINFRNISKQNLIVAVIVGITSAFLIYSWFYVVREVYRLISIGFDYMPNILSESDRDIYNLFFAFLSLIFGNSIAISFLFSEPQKIINKRNPKRRRLLNDQIFLNFNFAYWFTKVGLAFGVFSMYMEFNFVPYFDVFLGVLLLALYLEPWKTLSQILGKRRWKYLIIHALILSSLSLLMSRIDIVNYKKMDEIALKNNPIINLPYSDFSNTRFEYGNRTISFKLKVDETGNLLVFTEYREKLELDEIASFILTEKHRFRPELMDRLMISISIDKNVDILNVKRLEAELLMINQFIIIYDVCKEDLLTCGYERNGIKRYISPSVLGVKKNTYLNKLPLPVNNLSFKQRIYKDTLKIRIGSEIKVDGLIVPALKLSNVLKEYINPETVFEYEYSQNTKYQHYINVLSAHNKAADELVRSHFENLPNFPNGIYDLIYLSDDEVSKIREFRKKYPINIIERHFDSFSD